MSQIVYGILCHHSAEYVQEQYRLLYTPDTYFIYHIDETAPSNLRSLVEQLALHNPNVSLVPSKPCSWAGFSLTQAMLNIMSAALLMKSWSHIVFLSEVHLPLQSNEFISTALEQNHNYAEIYEYNTFYQPGKIDIRSRYYQIYEELPGVGSFSTALREPPKEFYDSLRHGSQWIILCHKTCEQLQDKTNKIFLDIFQKSVLSDENALQTWIANINDSEVINENRKLTYVADPSHGGKNDMTFSEDLFFQAKEKKFLFIRKRSQQVPDSINNLYEILNPEKERPTRIPYNKDTYKFNEKISAQSLSEYLNTKIQEFGSLIPVSEYNDKPAFFYKLLSDEIEHPFGIYIASQDLIHFKIIAAYLVPFNGFGDSIVGEYRTSIIRARLTDLSFAQEIHVADDLNHGFVKVESLDNASALTSLLKDIYVRTQALSINLKNNFHI